MYQPELFEGYTDKFLGKLEGSPGILLDLCAENDWTEEQAITELMAISASSYTEGMTFGESAEFLSAWHRQLRNRCSAVYAVEKALTPEASREEINERPLLIQLNGVRKGLRTAMNRDYAHTRETRQAFRQRPWYLTVFQDSIATS